MNQGLAAGRGLTLATADINTGGRLASLFGDDAAAPHHYRGGWVLHLADALDLVGGDGADLEGVALSVAGRARAALGANAGMAALAKLSDAPDPATGRYQGTLIIATDLNGQTGTKRHEFASTAADLRRRAILWGAEFLRLELLKQ